MGREASPKAKVFGAGWPPAWYHDGPMVPRLAPPASPPGASRALRHPDKFSAPLLQETIPCAES